MIKEIPHHITQRKLLDHIRRETKLKFVVIFDVTEFWYSGIADRRP